jgi:hypothetical protein
VHAVKRSGEVDEAYDGGLAVAKTALNAAPQDKDLVDTPSPLPETSLLVSHAQFV